MNGFERFDSERGISPVIGVILMVAITVLLAATAATFFLGFQDDATTSKPSAAFDIEFDISTTGTDTVTIEHTTGDTIDAGELSVVVSGVPSGGVNQRYDFESLDGAGGIAAGSSVDAGVSVRLDPSTLPGPSSIDFSDATVKVVWTAGSGESGTILAEATPN